MIVSWSATGDGGDDADGGAVRGRRLQTVGEADVVLADIHVDEPPQLSVVVEHARPDPGVLRVELVEQLGQRGRPVHRDLGLAARQRAQDGRHPHRDAHRPAPWSRSEIVAESRPASRNDSSVGLIVTVGFATGATASRVLSPSPVLRITVSAAGSSVPSRRSLRSVATVTPPAVSANT